MKKTIRLFSHKNEGAMKTQKILLIFSLCAAIGCSKENLPENTREISFSAEFESTGIDGKAVFDGTSFTFENGDKIRVCEKERTNKKGFTFKSSTGNFTGEGLNESDCYYCVFRYQATAAPGSTVTTQVANLDAPASGYDVRLYSTIYDHQQAVLNGYDTQSAPMYGKALASDMTFKFILGVSLLKIDLQYEGITSVVLTSPNGTTLAGNCGYDLKDEDGDGWFDGFSLRNWDIGNSSTITLIPPVGQTIFPKGVYYIVARPGKTHGGGLSLTLYNGETPVKTFSKTSSVTLNRAKIRNLGTFSGGTIEGPK